MRRFVMNASTDDPPDALGRENSRWPARCHRHPLLRRLVGMKLGLVIVTFHIRILVVIRRFIRIDLVIRLLQGARLCKK